VFSTTYFPPDTRSTMLLSYLTVWSEANASSPPRKVENVSSSAASSALLRSASTFPLWVTACASARTPS
jgi:hypothetical protein